MSAIRLTKPTQAQAQGLRVINGGKLAQLLGKGQSKSRAAILVTILAGLGAIQLLQLLLSVGVSAATYSLSDLKHERDQLIMQQQILAEQVDSLSSNQNLANTAQKMGMISNANPVFLRLSDQRVFGKPKAALNADNRLSRNLIPSATLTVTSNLVDPATTGADASALLPANSMTLSPVAATALTTATTATAAKTAATATAPAAATGTTNFTLVPSTKTVTTVPANKVGTLPNQTNR